MAPDFNREFGIVENFQLAVILAIIYISLKAYKKSTAKLIRVTFLAVIIGSCLFFLEEIDYGLHIYDLVTGTPLDQIGQEPDGDEIRNIHNQGNITEYLKLSLYITFIVLFLLLPFIIKKVNISNPFVRWLIPTQNFIYSLIAMALMNRIALYIDKNLKYATVNALEDNVSEFEEIFINYIFLLYILELKNKKYPVQNREEQA